MVTTRASAKALSPPAQEPSAANGVDEPQTDGKKTWADTHGAGEHVGAWGLEGPAGYAVAYLGTLALMIGCPAFAIYMFVPNYYRGLGVF